MGKSYLTVSEKCYPTVSENGYPTVTDEYKKAVEEAQTMLRGLIADKESAQLMIRLARHHGGAYDVSTETGGPSRAMRHEAEQGHGANNGFEIADTMLQPIKDQFPILTNADLYQMAGVVAVKFTGGCDVPFHPGRPDKPEPPVEGRLPDATKANFAAQTPILTMAGGRAGGQGGSGVYVDDVYQFARMEARFAQMEAVFQQLEQHVMEIKAWFQQQRVMDAIEAKFQQLEQCAMDVIEAKFQQLEQCRMDAIEAKFQQLEQCAMDAIEAKFQQLEQCAMDAIEAIEAKFQQLEQRVMDVQMAAMAVRGNSLSSAQSRISNEEVSDNFSITQSLASNHQSRGRDEATIAGPFTSGIIQDPIVDWSIPPDFDEEVVTMPEGGESGWGDEFVNPFS